MDVSKNLLWIELFVKFHDTPVGYLFKDREEWQKQVSKIDASSRLIPAIYCREASLKKNRSVQFESLKGL